VHHVRELLVYCSPRSDTSDDLCAVSTELSLWALGLADPVADDVYQIEALNNEQGSA
jgi:hypothetical protein